MASPAQQYWHNAQRTRRALLKQVEQLKRNNGDKSEETQLESVERLLSDYRLACVTTAFADFKYATKHGVDDSLWQLHSFVNNEYRSLLGDLKVPQQIVTKRKVEKLYTNYLRTSQYFYRGYIQRLWARYDVHELGRIAQSMRLESMPNATVDDEASADIQAGVIKSCHATLLHLGDLSRYRHKMRQKLHGSETALTYYSLAQDLNPDSGFAHHQMGVIYLEEKNHLEIVYHFYRAAAVQAPHPNARNNLEVEFKTLLHPSTPGKRSGPPDPNAAFVSWFVRLHARFFRGEAFPEHGELEEEVLHRFETALKTQGTFTLLLKMVLINISAYHVAQAKIKKKWTYPGSTSCQFILRLNVRFVLVLCRLLKSELGDIVKAVLPVEAEGGDKAPEQSLNFKPYAENILPLLRIYMTWTCTYRTDIVKYEAHLDHYVHDMYRTLGQALTMVIQEFLGQDLVTSSYLLPEDLEALGLEPLDDNSLPSECRLHYTPDQNTRKPRPGDPGCIQTTSQQELLSRIYDILSCGYFLATDRIFPFAMVTVQEESRDITAIAYQEEAASQQFDEPSTQGLPDQPNSAIGDLLGKFGDLQASPDARKKESRQESRHSLSNDGFGKRVQTHETQVHLEEDNLASPTQPMKPPLNEEEAAAEFESEFNVDSDMYHLVNDFLAPPESRSDHVNTGAEETSYSMHSSTANEVFGALHNKSPTPGSATAKAFPTLPWDFFISPAPHPPSQEGAMRSPEHGIAHQRFPDSQDGVDQFRTTKAMEDPFASSNALGSPFQDTRARTDALQSSLAGYNEFGVDQRSQGAYGRQTRSNYANTSQDNSTANERLSAQLPELTERSGNPLDQHGWPAPDAFSRGLDPPNALNSGSLWQGSGVGAGKPPFSSNFSQNKSSLPPVNSPWGMPAARQTLAGQQSNMYPYAQHGAGVDSSAPFSPPNNLYHSNGNYYNATTAFGRGPIANRDDPTHFKNAVKRTGFAAAAEAADAYDRAIFASALLDDNRPQR